MDPLPGATGRSGRPLRQLRVAQGDPAPLLAEGEALADLGDGWITMTPEIPVQADEPPQSLLSTVVTGPRHDAPVCTWLPGPTKRRQRRPDSLGIQHSTGTAAVARLAGAEAAVPDGWRVRQDHPRRGLVVEPPVATPVADEFTWLLRAGAALCRAPYLGRWEVVVHLPRVKGHRL